MKKTLIVILVPLILSGCAKQSSLALYAFNEKSNNKAFVITSSDGWGFSTAQVSTELAIMGAFYECEKKNPLSLCELEKVNAKYIFSKEEKDKWKNQYKNEKNNYVFFDGNVSHKDPSKNELTGKQ
jgi:prepilin-type processing-associated H-X9-DG protein